jgi:hypothetical protein
MATVSNRDDDLRVLASTPPVSRARIVLLVFQAALVAFWTWNIADDETGRTRAVVLLAGAGVLLLAAAALVIILRNPRSARLVLAPLELRIERRARPVVIPRRDVLAVRGNVPDRPSWSDRVLVQTPHRVHTLPSLDQPPSVLVPELQRWAGVTERAGARSDGTCGTHADHA